MIRPEMIPDEVVDAAAIERWGINEPTKWELDTCRIIIAAALAAWPGVLVEWHSRGPGIILPLPEAPQERGASTENSDD